MKNIAIIVPYLRDGGAERIAANMSVELEKKYNVYMIVFDGSNITYKFGGKLIDINIPPEKNSGIMKKIINIIKRTKAVGEIKKKYNISCTVSHMEGANIVNILSGRKGKIITVRHTTINQNAGNKEMLLHKFFAGFSYKYIQVSELAAYNLVNKYGFGRDKIECIHNFADVESIAELSDRGLLDNTAKEFYEGHKQVIISMGRLSKPKAQRCLIKAFFKLHENLPGSGLVILGEGDKRTELEYAAAEINLKKDIYMPGNIENPFPYLKSADVFVLSSLREGLPMVLIEAAACGCAIISTDMMSGAREVLDPDSDITHIAEKKEYGKYGILVPVDDEAEMNKPELSESELILAEAMEEMVQNEALRNKYKSRSAECAANYSSDVIIKKWIELIES